jgi:hypothetical protein
MRTPGLTIATHRFARAPRTATVLLAAGAVLTAVALGLAIAASWLAVLAAGAAVLAVHAGVRERRRETWTVSVAPDGTLTTTARSVVMHYTMRDTANLNEARTASAGQPTTIWVDDACAQGRPFRDMDLLTLSAGPTSSHGCPPHCSPPTRHCWPRFAPT